jgi:competence protein ComEC
MPLHAACVMACWLLGMAWQFQQRDLTGQFTSAGVAVGLAAVVAWAARLLGRRLAPQSNHWPRLLVHSLVAALLGWAHAQWQATALWRMQWPAALEGQVVYLTGRVDSMPLAQTWGQQFEVAVDEVAVASRHLPNRVSLVWADAPDTLLPGQTWRWAVKLQAPHGRMNPGTFDTERWMFQQGLRAQGKVHTKEAAVLLAQPAWGGAGLLDRWRVQLARKVQAGVPSPELAGLLVGLTLGQQSAISEAHWRVLRHTGIAHLAAISGLHITMLGWLCGVCAGALWRRSPRLMMWVPAVAVARWATLLGALGYALLAGWGIPAQRTVCMLAIVVGLQSSARRWPWPLVLLLAAVAVTTWDPWALVQVSFWLSFAAVGLLMLASPEPPLHTHAPTWLAGVREHLHTLWRTQWVATLGLAPLSLVCFNTLSLVGLVVNLVCVPLFTLVITPLALLGYAWPSAWTMAASLLEQTLLVLTPIANHPSVLWQSAEVHNWAAWLALLAAGVWLMPLPWRWRMLTWPALLCLCWPNSLSQQWAPPAVGQVQVVAADVGQGTAVLVRTATHALLFDAGPKLSESSDMGLKVLVGLLRAMGVSRLDEFVISHADADHVGGAAAVLRHVRVVGLRTSLDARHPLLAQPDLVGQYPSHVPCQAGQRWQWDGVDFEVLHPLVPPSQLPPALGDNARSCVLKVHAQGQRVLITGDLEAPQEAQLLAHDKAQLQSDVLFVPHHGSKTSSTEAFLAAVQPKVAVIQAGWRNRYGHPHAQVVKRYRSQGVALVHTAHCGAWLWASDATGAGLHGRCWREVQRRYWHAQKDLADMTPP